MNVEVKAKWLDALRSGNYLQGQKVLHGLDDKGRHTFCCLGVLCDLYVQAHPEDGWTRRRKTIDNQKGFTLLSSRQESQVLPEAVKEWAGLPTVYGPFNARLPKLNDEGYTFAELADIIEVSA